MVLNDFKKNAFDLLRENKSDYLLIDLIDERHGTLARKNSVITLSSELIASRFIRFARLRRRSSELFMFLGIARRADLSRVREYCAKIKEIYAPERVFVHKAFLMEDYLSLDGRRKKFPWHVRRYSRNFNRMIGAMYDVIVSELPGCQVIDECANRCAFEGHRWGLSPPHYGNEYYQRVLEELLARLK